MATATPDLTFVDPSLLTAARREVKSLRDNARSADRALARLEEDLLARLGIKVEYVKGESQ